MKTQKINPHLAKLVLVLVSAVALAACGGSEDTGGGGASGGAGGSGGGGDCALGGGEAPVGACLVAMHAGTYAVTPSTGTHSRGTIVIGDDGSVDYDTALAFAVVDYEGVYDRLDCCNRISVELKQRPDNDTTLAPDARHRVDIFTTSSVPGSAVVRFEYFPNWPATDGMVALDVSG